MKKSILLLTGLLVLTLAGCGSTTTPETPSSQAVVTESSSVEETSAEISEEASSEEVESSEEEIPATYLRELYAEHGLKVGTCLTPQMISNAQHSKLILEQFNSVTMENAMKPDAILSQKLSKENGEITVEFGKDLIKMLDWAQRNDMSVRGHTLVWYSQTPSWIFYDNFDTKGSLVTRDVMLHRMEVYIKQVFDMLTEQGYADMFYAYDVVNEAWMEDGSMRQNLWSETIGDDYLWYAFYYANKYAPENINLFYNDYNEQYKTETLVKFVNTLVDENGEYLIDGIGLQAHLYTNDDQNTYFRTVDKLAETGLIIEMTELDVCLGAWQKPLKATDDNLAKQGRYYYNLIDGIFQRIDEGTLKMDAITFWGFCDSMSWRREYSPLLYNITFHEKPAYYGAAQLKELAGF